jgi:hypothetical protein
MSRLIDCPKCGKSAVIRSSAKITDTSRTLYCQCKQPESCGAIFTYLMTFGHVINPPLKEDVRFIGKPEQLTVFD